MSINNVSMIVSAVCLLLSSQKLQAESCTGIFECSDSVERNIVTENPKLFSRDKNVLSIKRTNGECIQFLNTDEDNVGGTRYEMVAFYPEVSMYILRRSQYYGESIEFRAYKLTDSIEAFDVINGLPSLSPDGRYIVAYASDFQANFGPNGLSIYSIHNNGISLLFQMEGSDWGVGSAVWRTSELIEYEVEHDAGNGYQRSKRLLRKAGPDWFVEIPGK